MAFKLDKKPYYKLPVTCSTSADNGLQESESFIAYIARLPQDRIDEISEKSIRRYTQIKHGEKPDEDVAEYTYFYVADEILVGWEEITVNGEDIGFTASTKEEFLKSEGVATAIVNAWIESKKADTAKKPTSKKSRGIG